MENYFLIFDLSVAEKYPRNIEEAEFISVVQAFKAEALKHMISGRFYLPNEFTVNNFYPGYDEAVRELLEECIPSFDLSVNLEHIPEEKVCRVHLY